MSENRFLSMNIQKRKPGRPPKVQPQIDLGIGTVVESSNEWVTETPSDVPEQQFLAMSEGDTDQECDDDQVIEDDEHETVGPTVYRWEIPGADGYTLRIEREAFSVEAAKIKAFEPGPDGRELTPLECNWIEHTAPEVVKATLAVTLEHEAALRDNERLREQNLTYQLAKSLFDLYGIDIEDPITWVNSKLAEAQSKIDNASQIRAAKVKRLVEDMQNVQRAVQDAIDSDPEFAPPKPVQPQEPDYSKLVIVADGPAQDMPARYPRIAKAQFIDTLPAEPLTTEEMVGFDLVFNVGDGIIEDYRIKRAGPGEQEPLRAIQRRIKALVGMAGESDVDATLPIVSAPISQREFKPTGIPPAIPVIAGNGDEEFVSGLANDGSGGGWKVQK